MSRPLLIDFPVAFYHITSRDDARQVIYKLLWCVLPCGGDLGSGS